MSRCTTSPTVPAIWAWTHSSRYFSFRIDAAASAGVGCYPPGVAERVFHAGGALLVGLVFGGGYRRCSGGHRALVGRVHVVDVHVDRGGLCAGMGRVADFHHDHRVADFRLDMKALADREMFQLHCAESPLHQLQHIQAAVEIGADAADAVTDVFVRIAHWGTLPADIVSAWLYPY